MLHSDRLLPSLASNFHRDAPADGQPDFLGHLELSQPAIAYEQLRKAKAMLCWVTTLPMMA